MVTCEQQQAVTDSDCPDSRRHTRHLQGLLPLAHVHRYRGLSVLRRLGILERHHRPGHNQDFFKMMFLHGNAISE